MVANLAFIVFIVGGAMVLAAHLLDSWIPTQEDDDSMTKQDWTIAGMLFVGLILSIVSLIVLCIAGLITRTQHSAILMVIAISITVIFVVWLIYRINTENNATYESS